MIYVDLGELRTIAMNPRDHHISLNSRNLAIHATKRFASLMQLLFFRQPVVTSATIIKNEHHDDDVGRMNGQTDADLYSEKDRGGGRNRRERKKGRERSRVETGETERAKTYPRIRPCG